MHRLIRHALALGLLALAFGPPASAATLRVMSFNVRLPSSGDGANRWEARRDLMVRTIAEQQPDLIGTQELHARQGDYIVAKLPQYAWFGEGRRGGNGGEHMGVFYRTDRLAVIDSGSFWLSDTPDVPGSISWGHPYPRMVTWAVFMQKASGERFYLYNTHLPYRPEDAAARRRAAQEILAHIKARPGKLPVLLIGDFNDVPGSPTYRLLTGYLRDARVTAPVRNGPDATFHGFTGKPDRRIDWILSRGWRALSDTTVTTHQGPRFPSDHFPVIAVLQRTASGH